MKEKVILVMDGGTMCGIFGGGVMARLEELNIYDRIEAIYAGSAGAYNAAYFLAKQSKYGVPVYLDYLTKKFIFPHKFWKGMTQRLYHRYIKEIPEDDFSNILDIGFVIDVLKNKVPLDIEELQKQTVPLFISVLNTKTRKLEYIPIKGNDILEILKASSCIAPYTFESGKINGIRYIDGTIGDPIGLERIRAKHPNSKIILISNIRGIGKARHKAKAILEGMVTNLMYGGGFVKIFLEREDEIRRDILLCEEDPNIFLINAPEDCPVRPRTRDKGTLQIGYDMGYKEGGKIVSWL